METLSLLCVCYTLFRLAKGVGPFLDLLMGRLFTRWTPKHEVTPPDHIEARRWDPSQGVSTCLWEFYSECSST